MFVAVVPAFNEEKKIGPVVRSLFSEVDKVVVIDDGSSDNTSKVAAESGAIVLRHRLNRGQGAALETGHEFARRIGAEFVLHFDADGQFDVADVMPMLEALKVTKADIAFGSRYLSKDSKSPFFKRFFLHPAGRIVNLVFAGLWLSDAHNGFRILNRRALETIVIRQERMAHATEIPLLVKKSDLKYIEFPVQVSYHEYGQGLSGGFRIIRDILVGRFIKS